MKPPPNVDFVHHLWKNIYDISYFIIITVIGLNVIFGIIVDTFSELRDSKVSLFVLSIILFISSLVLLMSTFTNGLVNFNNNNEL